MCDEHIWHSVESSATMCACACAWLWIFFSSIFILRIILKWSKFLHGAIRPVWKIDIHYTYSFIYILYSFILSYKITHTLAYIKASKFILSNVLNGTIRWLELTKNNQLKQQQQNIHIHTQLGQNINKSFKNTNHSLR